MFFNKKQKDKEENNYSKIAALLIYAAKIDQNYSKEEEEIIKRTMLEIGAVVIVSVMTGHSAEIRLQFTT